MAKLLTYLGGVLLLISCTENRGSLEPVYRQEPRVHQNTVTFAIHPLHNPVLLGTEYGPLINYLNKNIQGVKFQVEASTSYAAFEEKLAHKKVEFALPNPYQALKAMKTGYHIFGKMNNDRNFRGIVLVRRDSGITKISQLRGKTISYPAPTALAATMMPQYYFFKHGLHVKKDTKSIYVGSQESSIMNVFLKHSQAGCTWPVPWFEFVKNNPDKAKELIVQWQTDPLLNNALVAREDVPSSLVLKVQALLLKMDSTEDGKKILENLRLTKFEAADEKTYRPVQIFIEQFTRDIRVPELEN